MMEYKLVKQVKDNCAFRNSFIALAIKTFDLSFENWYNDGFWTDSYIPYVLVDNDKVIANASVNVIHTIWQGISMETLLAEIAAPGTQQAVLGFTPKDTKGCECAQIDGEDTLFVLSKKENVFAENEVMFPSLSHA